MNQHRHAPSERSFGLTVGSAFCALAAVLAWRGRTSGMAITGSAGALLIALAWVAPALLVWPSAAWWRLSHVLGWVSTRIWLTVMFVAVVVPVGLVWRLTGHDPLGRARGRATGWSACPGRYRNPHHFLRMLPSQHMGKTRVLTELWELLRQEKKYWLAPIVIVFVLFGLLVAFAQTSVVAPFIYSLF